MVEFFRALYAIMATLPFVSFVLIFCAAWLWKREPQFSLRLATDVTVPFLFSAVSVLWQLLTGGRGYVLTLLLFFSLAVLCWVICRSGGRPVATARWARAVWRSSFLFFGILYMVLFLLELIQSLRNGA